MLTSFDLEQRVNHLTHDQNGILDVVITKADLPPQFIKVADINLSYHHLVQWSLELAITTPVNGIISRCTWRSLNIEDFKSVLQNSLLCDRSIITSPPHSDEMVKYYNDVITNLFYQLLQYSRSPAFDESQVSGLIRNI